MVTVGVTVLVCVFVGVLVLVGTGVFEGKGDEEDVGVIVGVNVGNIIGMLFSIQH